MQKNTLPIVTQFSRGGVRGSVQGWGGPVQGWGGSVG